MSDVGYRSQILVISLQTSKIQYIDSFKQMDSDLGTKRQKLFLALIIIQLANLIVEIVAGTFMGNLAGILIRFIFLLAANYCNQINFAIFYSVFAIFTALNKVDPIGLFIVGHSKKTMVQNIFCIISLVLSIVGAYLGYLYGKQIGEQAASGAFNEPSDNYQSFSRPINQPNRASQPSNQSNNSYGGTNYFYQNPSNPSPAPPQRQSNRSQFQAFSGQGYSLE